MPEGTTSDQVGSPAFSLSGIWHTVRLRWDLHLLVKADESPCCPKAIKAAGIEPALIGRGATPYDYKIPSSLQLLA